MHLCPKRKILLLVLLFIVILTSLAIFLLWDTPRPLYLTSEEEDRRVFSVGTLENVTTDDFRILRIILTFDHVSSSQAHVNIDLAVEKKKPGVFETNFIFILPADVELYYPYNLVVLNKSYAKVVCFPFSLDNETKHEMRGFELVWPSFSKSVSLYKWTFDIECRAFHYLFDRDGETFHPLVPSSFTNTEDWIPLRIEVNIEDRSYSFVNFHPSTEENFESSVSWSKITSVFNFHVTGTYEDKPAKSVYNNASKVILFVAGAFSSLLLREIYLTAKEKLKQR